jgi:aspartyl-tRNA(Asn)/glutamyl-tRNA(Gln) amidotransferase subunit A
VNCLSVHAEGSLVKPHNPSFEIFFRDHNKDLLHLEMLSEIDREIDTTLTKSQYGRYPPFEIKKLSEGLRQRRINCEEVVSEEISNVESYNKIFNAFIRIFGGRSGPAMSRARELDSLFHKPSKKEKINNSLFGVPFSLKDNIFVSGYPTTAACGAFKDFVPKTNATIIDSILDCGGILVGKTNMHELALGATSSSSFFGPVRNPKDSKRISGGSSGGSAVSVALSKSPLVSLGTDTGGSVRIPAALCGVCGFKPSMGLLSTEGVLPLSGTLDHAGILTKTMPDMIIAFMALAKKKGGDSNRKKFSSGNQGSKIRIGIPKNYYVNDMDPQVSSAFWRTVEKLESLDEFEITHGVQIRDCTRVTRIRRTIQVKEAAWFYEELIRSRRKRKLLHSDVLSFLDSGLKVSMIGYMLALAARLDFVFEMWRVFKDIDFLLMPTCLSVAPKLEDVMGKETGSVRSLLIRNTEPFNLSGFPALSVPTNLQDKGSLPTAVQISGRYGEDLKVLEVGEKLWNAL